MHPLAVARRWMQISPQRKHAQKKLLPRWDKEMVPAARGEKTLEIGLYRVCHLLALFDTEHEVYIKGAVGAVEGGSSRREIRRLERSVL